MNSLFPRTLLIAGLFAFFACTPQPNDETTDATITDTDTTSKAADPVDPVDPALLLPAYGIDISQYQGNEMELLNRTKDSLSFVICRASEGITFVDPDFATNWKTIESKGFIRGAYHFYRSDDPPQAQATNYLKLIDDLEATDLPPIIDFEEMSIAKGANKADVIANLWKFIQILETKTGRKPIIYTDVNIGNSYLTDPKFANYTLWIANYSSTSKPTMPGAWKGKKWVLWQKSDDYSADGIQTDFDRFNGTVGELKEFIASGND